MLLEAQETLDPSTTDRYLPYQSWKYLWLRYLQDFGQTMETSPRFANNGKSFDHREFSELLAQSKFVWNSSTQRTCIVYGCRAKSLCSSIACFEPLPVRHSPCIRSLSITILIVFQLGKVSVRRTYFCSYRNVLSFQLG